MGVSSGFTLLASSRHAKICNFKITLVLKVKIRKQSFTDRVEKKNDSLLIY
jgi:hypothetical protein